MLGDNNKDYSVTLKSCDMNFICVLLAESVKLREQNKKLYGYSNQDANSFRSRITKTFWKAWNGDTDNAA